MFEEYVIGETLPEAYDLALFRLKTNGSVVPCPAYSTRQLEVSMTMVVKSPLKEPMISRMMPGGPEDLEQYCMEMLDGILDFEVSKGNWEYTYHDRMANWDGGAATGLDQIAFVIRELQRDANSRRAVIDVRNNREDMNNEDPACLQHIQYFVREGKLHCKVLFRSNDAVKATFMNAFALIMLQKRITEALGLEMGMYTHRANSFHAYEKDWDLLSRHTQRLMENSADGSAVGGLGTMTYNYAGDWDELMTDAREEIMEKVNDLKRRL